MSEVKLLFSWRMLFFAAAPNAHSFIFVCNL